MTVGELGPVGPHAVLPVEVASSSEPGVVTLETVKVLPRAHVPVTLILVTENGAVGQTGVRAP